MGGEGKRRGRRLGLGGLEGGGGKEEEREESGRDQVDEREGRP